MASSDQAQTFTYQRLSLPPIISITNLITMYYFEYGKDYVFHGEKHDFWELLYVDRGEVEVHADETTHILQQGTIIFHKPNEFHSFYSLKGKAPNLIVITFDCLSDAMHFFENKVISLNSQERNLLTTIIAEGQRIFPFPFQYPLARRHDAPPGSEQLLRNYLEILLIRLHQRMDRDESETPLTTMAQERSMGELVSKIAAYMADHLHEQLSVAALAQLFCIGRSQLADLFKKQTGSSLMEYFAKLKINQAKIMIREETYNFTEIAGLLGFSSVHYFSKAFKKATRMSPTEYARTVKSRMPS
ncbi:AraC family transcriptional regulator [Paenibacillus whitsoniae]|nr:AraC family transcriptional regulator [Paenibacillus whitsoniae]